MRLLNAETLEFEEYAEVDVPSYAILSHQWGREEVSFADWNGPGERERRLGTREGYRKIKSCCRQALNNRYRHVWVDTCCIDKSSSAELSEAINSMYKWYRKAAVCYVYMADVKHYMADGDGRHSFRASRWFSRGWTLQELIAPDRILFYDMEWNNIGTKFSRIEDVYAVTYIDQGVLLGRTHISEISIARRMSWAARRETTRPEDMAYCLMGIFELNMPMLYGEGENAFIRLQMEILRGSDDHSIFAWEDSDGDAGGQRGLLARHPRDFRNSKGYIPAKGKAPDSLLVTATNQGINLKMYFPTPKDEEGEELIASLGCCHKADGKTYHVGIHLRCASAQRAQYVRIRPASLEPIDPRDKYKHYARSVYVKQVRVE